MSFVVENVHGYQFQNIKNLVTIFINDIGRYNFILLSIVKFIRLSCVKKNGFSSENSFYEAPTVSLYIFISVVYKIISS